MITVAALHSMSGTVYPIQTYLIGMLMLGLTLLATGLLEKWMGRTFLGPDGKFSWWEGSIWSRHCSQRVIDPYSLSHVSHGILIYGLLWLFARPLPILYGFGIALFLEASWEILENSPLIINRYRQVTIALGYNGDSILNSLSDILMMSIGFLAATHLSPWMSITALVAMELGCAWWVRDNLTLNMIMLLCPIKAIRTWQMAARLPDQDKRAIDAKMWN